MASNFSKKRELIYQTICQSDKHPTADMLYARLKPDNLEISLGTIYRNLNSLCEDGRIIRLSVPSGPERFDGNLQAHYHIVCDNCGGVYDIRLSSLPDLKTARHIDGHQIDSLMVIFHGICSNCCNSIN